MISKAINFYKRGIFKKAVRKKIIKEVFPDEICNVRVGVKYSEKLNETKRIDPIVTDIKIGEVEINNNCNLNCLMCRSWEAKRENNYMHLDIFERACSEAVSLGNKIFNIYTIGEPLLNPNLTDYLELLRAYRLKTNISTNGLLLHKNNNIKVIMDHADIIRHLRFSVDGATKETYEKIRTPGKFNRLIDNLDMFSEANKDGQVLVKFDSILSTDNKDEIARYFSVFSKYTDMEQIDFHFMNGLAPDNKYFFEASVLPQYICKIVPCERQMLSGFLHILCNGDVTACRRDYHGDLVYGNIMEDSAMDLINNPKIIALREAHLNNNIAENIFCSNCFGIERKVIDLFSLFVEVIVKKHKLCWDEEVVQDKFNKFFEFLEVKIPSKKEFLKLLQ